MAKIKRALISVSDKKGIVEFAKGLEKLGIEIISTGGTAKTLREGRVKIKAISDVTGFPEMLSGRVKTLHPKIHGGILAIRGDRGHMDQVKKHKIGLIDMVVVNLYPFEDTVRDPKVKLQDAIEMIDIGGPAMVRSAAKNYRDVAIICNPDRYLKVLMELQQKGCSLSEETLEALAVEAFGHTAKYDAAIYTFLSAKFARTKEKFPEILHLVFERMQGLRYGENPHQKAAFYADSVKPRFGFGNMKQLHGKELSFNNLLDLQGAMQIVKDFSAPTACVVKHNSPCGVASAPKLEQAYKDAFACDTLSAFGGIIGLNRRVDAKTAKAISDSGFMECVIAPAFDEGALAILKLKKNIRLIEYKDAGARPAENVYACDVKKVEGGLLLQEQDLMDAFAEDLKSVTKKKANAEQLKSLVFAWKVAKHVKSNAIVIAKGTRTVGIGGGQPSRVDSMRIAIRKAGKEAKGACAATDGFFPKPDSVQLAGKAKLAAIIQPGGSIKDEDSFRAAEKAGMAMVVTGIRHFRH
ncbi:MAG TPA: bifunctional phosphoribosylaminoimidazolecarboxamide formyltransferase/IMP cyclohydrolase [Candidatus Omnitrophota bacterium]|nr:bifunctional phosphoribosylaminoimidazolecarboxamide formyltransferase/IMP cyclohydrolase [Candidatus Omnitrophota bacterium]MDD5269646.1 bifunctional phosphoribosylaminoimidazolecarboxamide formyltransferase/IMP cyclohydrolase [Candidatus Omnitrophota bacterium]HRZ67430.1 bifunctional phosphoribosylaminoimidazolecarboxamide formyltransferase/IMP cyclohydrolase [Candidatus Omnitrophota bacterium]